MDFTLLIISKLSNEVMQVAPVTFGAKELATLGDLHRKMHDLYPALDVTSFNLYWRYSSDLFHQIWDYISFITVLELSSERVIFVLVDDTDGRNENNESYLRKLDMLVR